MPARTSNSNVAPNTRIAVAGLGTVILKRIVQHDEAKKGLIKVDMVHIIATATSAGAAANQIGKLISLSVPCQGTNGKTVTASLDALSVANLLQIHNAETTVFAQDTYRNAKRQSSSAGTTVSGLVVDGASHGTVDAPNKRINIKGVGYVVVNETDLASPGSNDPNIVRGLHLYVTQQNSYGLPVGAEIVIAQATSVVHPSGTAQVATVGQ